jgi:hypothetical protein
MLVYGHHSIEIHYIVLPVKFDDGLSITVLRNVQLFTKSWRLKTIKFSKSSDFQILQTPPLGKRTDHPLEKSLSFLDLDFLASGIDDTPSNLTWT